MPTLENKKNHKSMTSVSTLTKIRREKKNPSKQKKRNNKVEINDIEYRNQ